MPNRRPNPSHPPHTPPQLINFSIFFHPEHSFSIPSPLRLLIIGECFQPEFETIYLCWRYTYTSQKEWPVCRVFCFASSCEEVLYVSIKKPTYCQLLTLFCVSHRMFDAFIECVTWSYWWTLFVSPIICNSKHFSFFVFYFNVSSKISSIPPRLLNIQFSNPPFVPTPLPPLLLGTQE